jgi:hypothetical protein
MNMRLHTVCDEDISAVEAEPIKLEILHYGELLDPSLLDDWEESEKEHLLGWKPTGISEVFYVDAAFQSLHYLLTGETEWGKGEFPLNFLTGQRRPLGEIGWGRANCYTAADVKQIAVALNQVNLENVKTKFDPDLFNKKEINPRGYTWTEKDRDSLLERLRELKSFVNNTAGQNLGFYIVVV